MKSAPGYRDAAGSDRPLVRAERSALRPFSLFIISILLLLAGSPAVSGALTNGNTVAVTDPLDAAALVYVSGYEVSPEVFYPGETGTVTVYVTNSANTSVSVSQPNLLEPNLKVISSGAYATAASIGPGETVEYNFVVTAGSSDGTIFPLFTVSTHVRGASAINSQIKVKIDSTDIRASIAVKPDTFAQSTKDIVNVSVVNPRDGEITDILIIPEGTGAEISPEETYVGSLESGSSVQVPFAITPEKDTEVTFHITYNNGDNKHTKDIVLPIDIGDNKKGAQMVVNNIESSSSGTTMTMKGDVTNNGLTDARSVIVTVGSPATPVNPNPVYAIGNLEPDDFSSFEVTYTATGNGAIPVIIEYKDEDGNVFTETFSISADSSAAAASGSASASGAPSGGPGGQRGGMMGMGSGISQLPVTQIAIILVLIVAILVAWRKGLLKPITDKFKRKSQDDDDDLQQEH